MIPAAKLSQTDLVPCEQERGRRQRRGACECLATRPAFADASGRRPSCFAALASNLMVGAGFRLTSEKSYANVSNSATCRRPTTDTKSPYFKGI
jgi:hypothetical protein